MNLLKETIDFLAKHNHYLDDVEIFCGDHFQFTLEEFKKVANVEYDESYGYPEVALDLKLIGDDWWIERSEYDGIEKWVFRKLPRKGELPYVPLRALIESQAVAGDDVWGGYENLLSYHVCSDKYNKLVSCDGCTDKDCPMLRKEIDNE